MSGSDNINDRGAQSGQQQQSGRGMPRTGAGADTAFEAMVKKRRARPGRDDATEAPQPPAEDRNGASDA